MFEANHCEEKEMRRRQCSSQGLDNPGYERVPYPKEDEESKHIRCVKEGATNRAFGCRSSPGQVPRQDQSVVSSRLQGEQDQPRASLP